MFILVFCWKEILIEKLIFQLEYVSPNFTGRRLFWSLAKPKFAGFIHWSKFSNILARNLCTRFFDVRHTVYGIPLFSIVFGDTICPSSEEEFCKE